MLGGSGSSSLSSDSGAQGRISFLDELNARNRAATGPTGAPQAKLFLDALKAFEDSFGGKVNGPVSVGLTTLAGDTIADSKKILIYPSVLDTVKANLIRFEVGGTTDWEKTTREILIAGTAYIRMFRLYMYGEDHEGDVVVDTGVFNVPAAPNGELVLSRTSNYLPNPRIVH